MQLVGQSQKPAKPAAKQDFVKKGTKSVAKNGARHRLSTVPVIPSPGRPDENLLGFFWVRFSGAGRELLP